MFRAIIWKEFREQGLIGLTLLVLGSGLLVAVAMQSQPGVEDAAPSDVLRYLGLGRAALLMLAVTAGMVCGGAVFAAERESGTMIYLDSLPTSHARIWRAKFAAGILLTVAQVVALIVVAALLGLVTSSGWTISVLTYSLLAFGWGLFGSTLARTTLGSIGLAIPAATTSAIFALVPTLLFFHSPGSTLIRPAGAILFIAIMLTLPMVLSAWLFSRSDRERTVEEPHERGWSFHSLYWLALHQSFLPGAAISAFAVFMGATFLAPGVQPFLYWPAAALLAGALSGVLAFADEQGHGSSRYWSEQRLPIGRLWLVKIGCHLLLVIWLLILLATPLFIRSQFVHSEVSGQSYGHSFLSVVFATPLFDELGRQGWKYLLVPAAYGFAAGHLCGLFFRKLVVACAVACLIGGTGTVLWGPSLLAGGVSHWQVWIPPVLLLLTSRLLLGAWTADQLLSRRPLAIFSAGALGTSLALAGALSYRVLEVPDSPSGEDDLRYLARMMPFEENFAGRDLKTAAERYASTVTSLNTTFDKPSAATPVPPQVGRFRHAEERLEMVAYSGWPRNDANLDAWLEGAFTIKPAGTDEKSWHAIVASTATRPLGIYEHPMMIGPQGVSGNSLEYARRMSLAILARGLQLQARGDSTAFLGAFQSAMTVSRSMRNGSVVACLLTGFDVERLALMCMYHWLHNLPPAAVTVRALSRPLPPPLAAVPALALELAMASENARLIQELIHELEPLDHTAPFDPTPQYLAERFVVRETLKAPAQLFAQSLGLSNDAQGPNDPIVELLSVAWAVPWERERTRRLVGLGFESGQYSDYSVTSGRPGAGTLLVVRNRTPRELADMDRQLQTHRRASLLMLALTAERLKSGHYPDKLADLVVSGELDRVPADPYDDTRSFGYRVSPGEVLRSAPRVTNEKAQAREEGNSIVVSSGQAIIWSVGPDRMDQGGKNAPGPVIGGAGRAEDLVFLVPPGPSR